MSLRGGAKAGVQHCMVGLRGLLDAMQHGACRTAVLILLVRQQRRAGLASATRERRRPPLQRRQRYNSGGIDAHVAWCGAAAITALLHGRHTIRFVEHRDTQPITSRPPVPSGAASHAALVSEVPRDLRRPSRGRYCRQPRRPGGGGGGHGEVLNGQSMGRRCERL
ncbi:hypothetical protein E2C01_007393 [Portunus trituberculatus]|uniref:Uncharacterized protein n=1 Tax=Portunus trituberculatus TaxID=210409 RepID=A0A5B7D027_PORTR|nr:hypothetical protein [Portunus trituberculatus]